jgi:hypothetical protein
VPNEVASLPNTSDEMLADSFLQLPADEFDMMFEPLQRNSSFDPSFMPESPPGPPPPFPYDSSLTLLVDNPLCPAESFLPTSSQPDNGTTL